MSMTHYENRLSSDAFLIIDKLVLGSAPEYVMEALADRYESRPGVYNRIAAVWCLAAASQICEELPGHPKQKDFPDENLTIGQKVKLIIDKNPKADIAETVDYVINKCVVKRMVKELESKK